MFQAIVIDRVTCLRMPLPKTLATRSTTKSDNLELLSPPSVSTINFRYVPTGTTLDNEALDALNQNISDAISDSDEAHIPTTKVNGVVSLRACFLHYENCEEDVHHLVSLIHQFGEV